MELCTTRAFSKLPAQPRPFLSLNRLSISHTNLGRVNLNNTSLRATSSEESSTGSRQYLVEDPLIRIGYKAAEKDSVVGSETTEREESIEDTPTDEPTQAFELLDKLDIKLDSEDTPSVLLLGGGSLIAVWIATVLVGAIDSIPLFPKLMEVVGLAYTLWFSTRYLLFKENREELVVKIEEIKQQVLGSSRDD